jgi:hypothetical protein
MLMNFEQVIGVDLSPVAMPVLYVTRTTSQVYANSGKRTS